jgi:hypothetical protein
MISLKTILIEGRYDSLVTKLSAECIRVLKDSYSAVTDPRGYFAGSKIYYDANETGLDINNDQYPHILFHEVENVNIPLEFYFTLKVKWNDAIDGFNYGGDAYNETSKNAVGNAKRGLDMLDDNWVRNSATRDSWFGTTDLNLITGPISTYLFNNQLESFLNTFRNQTVNLDVVDIDQQKSIKFTEKEIGIFSFDLASLGLIRVFEYYSPLLERIVSPNFIKSRKGADGKLVFYHIFVPAVPAHKVEYDIKKGGYYSKILKRIVSKSELSEVVTDTDIYFEFPERKEVPQHDVERRQQVDEKGVKKFSSTFKKSFIYIPQIEKPLPRIDIIATASYNAGVDAKTQMIYSSMAAIAVAEKLSKSGVNYRIIAAYPVQTSGGGTKKQVYTFVTLKKELPTPQ